MSTRRLASVILGLLLGLSLPGTAVAQEEGSTSPEGVRWDLVGYLADDELMTVPWNVDATFLMEEGTASGSGGCNRFSTGYVLEADTLTFEEQVAVTLMACPDEQTSVEDAYLALLPAVATWAISEEDSLELADVDGSVVLVFEQPSMGLTRSDLAALAADLVALEDEIDGLRAAVARERAVTAKLRDRIRALEAAAKQAAQQAAEAKKKAATTFTAAEQVLLKGVPADIRATCSPRRSDNPAGTVAAVQCKPDAAVVRDMAYYLMELDDAERVFEQRAKDNIGKNQGLLPCTDGKPAWGLGTPFGGEACYRNADGRANLRIVEGAGSCRQLTAGGTQIKKPAFYIAVLGEDGNIKKLAEWADGRRIHRQIEQAGAKPSKMCPS